MKKKIAKKWVKSLRSGKLLKYKRYTKSAECYSEWVNVLSFVSRKFIAGMEYSQIAEHIEKHWEEL